MNVVFFIICYCKYYTFNFLARYLEKRRNSMKTLNEKTVGVVVGRFHVAKLHAGHRYLLSAVASKNSKLLIVVGETKSLPTNKNPLTFEMRKEMLQKEFPEAIIVSLSDHKSDTEWNRSLDSLVEKMFPDAVITMYGSRDSFLTTYGGRYAKEEIEQIPAKSGTEYRLKVAKKPLASKDFRQGVIHAVTARPGIPYPTVDTAVVRTETREILLAGKNMDGGKLRFIGGFFDARLDKSFELAARRETREETGSIETDEYRMLGSAVIPDWRYRGTNDVIITTFFRAKYIFGAPTPCDDIDRLVWIPYEKVMENLVPEHKELGEMLMKTLL